MNRFLENSCLIIGSLIVAGIVSSSGGSAFHSGIAGFVTGITGSTTSALATRSKNSKQKPPGKSALTWGKRSSQDSIENNKDIQVIEVFLRSKNIVIKTTPGEDLTDNIINSLSKFLGENYSSLREILSLIKRNMQKGTRFQLSLKKYTQKDVTNVCQFCTRLYEIAFLAEYHYQKSPRYIISAQAVTLSKAQKFFSGQWLERFVLLVAQKSIHQVSLELGTSLPFGYLINPQVILPNGDDFELDLIFFVDKHFFWIEAKSGNYQQHIDKYSKVSKILNLDCSHSIMVLPDISESQCDALSALFSMKVCSLYDLENSLIETIKKNQKPYN